MAMNDVWFYPGIPNPPFGPKGPLSPGSPGKPSNPLGPGDPRYPLKQYEIFHIQYFSQVFMAIMKHQWPHGL